jgi:hypothetical protein
MYSFQNDPWLRDDGSAWVQSPQMQGAHNISVKDLLLPNEKRWDKDKIESLFSLDVVRRILATPLFDMVENDRLLWIDDMQGQYSVKSGYKMLMNNSGKVPHSVFFFFFDKTSLG